MDSYERIQAALEGQPVDRVPVSVWYHFGSEHLAPEKVAKLHAEYQAAYAWDFLKVMFDYRLDYPDAVDSFGAPDLRLLLETVDWSEPFRKQIEVLLAVRAALGPTVPIMETVYSPWMYLVRHFGAGLSGAVQESQDLAEVLARLTDETCQHVRRVREMGCFGIYFPTTAAEQSALGDAFGLQRDCDRQVLDAASGMARMLHLHGRGIEADAVRDYPREVLHWDDRDSRNPSLASQRATNPCLMGGLTCSDLTTISISALRHQAKDAIEMAGDGFILAPGCSVSPSLSSRKMLALRDPSLLVPCGATRLATA